MSLSGKVALITGSSRGIGAAIATHYVSEGASVIINYVSNASAASSVIDSLNAIRAGSAVGVQADASTIEGGKKLIEETLKAFGKIDIVVLNAGISVLGTVEEVKESDFDKMFNANVKGVFFLVQNALPHLKEGARVILFSTSLTKNTSVVTNAIVYVATKGAIEQLSRVLAKDLGARGMTVNTISPGPIDTELFRMGKTEEFIKFYENMHPMKRIGRVEEVAAVAGFLASPAAGWVNGQNIFVNGGFNV